MTTDNSLRSILWNLLLIACGSFLFAIGANAILIHHKFIIGGLFGTSLLIFYKTDMLSPAIWYFILNIPLLAVGWLFMSRRFLLYSLFGIVSLTLFAQVLTLNFGIHNQLYAAVAGGVICGAGAGIILRSRGSGGGLDIVAIQLNQKYNFGVGKFYMIYNAILFSFALSQYEPDLIIASLIMTFISSIALEQVLAMFNQRKVVYIVSESKKSIAKMITEELHQGATLIAAKGAYSGKDKQLLMTITNNLRLKRLEEKVFNIDPDALFIVENSFNVIGSSFGKRKIY